jgi:hypothetical protein
VFVGLLRITYYPNYDPLLACCEIGVLNSFASLNGLNTSLFDNYLFDRPSKR